MSALNGQLEGTIAVGRVRVTTAVLLPATIRKCVEAFPRIRFLVEQDHYQDMLEHLRAGRLDYLYTTVRPDLPPEFKSENCSPASSVLSADPIIRWRTRPLSAARQASIPWSDAEHRRGGADSWLLSRHDLEPTAIQKELVRMLRATADLS